MTVAVKICGITEIDDAVAAAEAGADYIGLVFSDSPRRVALTAAKAIVQAVSPTTRCVGVFVNEAIPFVHGVAAACRLDAVQLQGNETASYCSQCKWPVIKGIRLAGPLVEDALDDYDVAAFVFDTHVEGLSGGTGMKFDWTWINGFSARPFMLAGGLNPDNVAVAIAEAEPFAVDVSSGVSRTPRLKDHAKIRAFVGNAKSVVRSRRHDWAMPVLPRRSHDGRVSPSQ